MKVYQTSSVVELASHLVILQQGAVGFHELLTCQLAEGPCWKIRGSSQTAMTFCSGLYMWQHFSIVCSILNVFVGYQYGNAQFSCFEQVLWILLEKVSEAKSLTVPTLSQRTKHKGELPRYVPAEHAKENPLTPIKTFKKYIITVVVRIYYSCIFQCVCIAQGSKTIRWNTNHAWSFLGACSLIVCTLFLSLFHRWIPIYINVSVLCTKPHANDHHLQVASVLSSYLIYLHVSCLTPNFLGCSMVFSSLKKRIKTTSSWSFFRSPKKTLGETLPDPISHLSYSQLATHLQPRHHCLPFWRPLRWALFGTVWVEWSALASWRIYWVHRS